MNVKSSQMVGVVVLLVICLGAFGVFFWRMRQPVETPSHSQPVAARKLSADWDERVKEIIFPSTRVPPGAMPPRPRDGRSYPVGWDFTRGEVPPDAVVAFEAARWGPMLDNLAALGGSYSEELGRDLSQMVPLLKGEFSGPQFVHRTEIAAAIAWDHLRRGRTEKALALFRGILAMGQIADRSVPAYSRFTGVAALRIGVRVKRQALAHIHRSLAGGRVTPTVAGRIVAMLKEAEARECYFAVAFSAKVRRKHGLSDNAGHARVDGKLTDLANLDALPLSGVKLCLRQWVRCRVIFRGLRVAAALVQAAGKGKDLAAAWKRIASSQPVDPVTGKAFRFVGKGPDVRLYGVGFDGVDDGGDPARNKDVVILPYSRF